MIAHAMWTRFRIPVTERVGCLFHDQGEIDWYDLRIAVKDRVKQPCNRRIWGEVNR
jgi:hypothetical protein